MGGEVDVRPQIHGRRAYDLSDRRRGAHRTRHRQGGHEEPRPPDPGPDRGRGVTCPRSGSAGSRGRVDPDAPPDGARKRYKETIK